MDGGALVRLSASAMLGMLAFRRLKSSYAASSTATAAKKIVNSKLKPRSLVVCGPSGVGKGTLLKLLQDDLPEAFAKAVSHTTRKPRPGEEDGVHYHFTSKEEMKKDIESGKFVEHADVHGNFYGTSVAAVDAVVNAGKICVLEIDVQGALIISKANLESHPLFMFIHPPSIEDITARLQGRGTETQEKIDRRVKTAVDELKFAEQHHDLFDVHMVNDDLERAHTELRNVFQKFYPWLKVPTN